MGRIISNEHGLIREIELAYVRAILVKDNNGKYTFSIYTDVGLQYTEEVDRFLTDQELYDGVKEWLNL